MTCFVVADGSLSGRATADRVGRNSKRDVTTRKAFLRRGEEVSSGGVSRAVQRILRCGHQMREGAFVPLRQPASYYECASASVAGKQTATNSGRKSSEAKARAGEVDEDEKGGKT